MNAAVTGWDVLIAGMNLVQTCFLAFLAFRARADGKPELPPHQPK